MMYVLTPIIFFAVMLALERFVLLNNGYDWPIKNMPPDAEVRARFGFVKIPRTLLMACICACMWLPIDSRPREIVGITFGFLYMLAAIWDVIVAKQYFRRRDREGGGSG